MALGSDDHRRAVELPVIAHVVQVALGLGALDRGSQVPNGFLGADDGSGLAVGGGLDVRNQLQELILVIGPGGREVGSAAKVIGGSGAPQSVNIVQQLLAEGLGHLVDEGVEVHTASPNRL